MRVALVIALLVGTAAVGHAKPGEQPSAVVVVIDRSLPADKLAAVTQALVDSLDTFDPGEQIAVISAGKTPTVEVPLQSASNKKKIAARLAGLRTSASGDLIAALRMVSALPRAKGITRNVLVVSDGNELIAISPIAAKLQDSGYTVSALGYQSLNRVTLENIATSGGGHLYLADDAKAIARAFVAEAQPNVVVPNLAVVFVIDRSGSMQGAKLEAAKETVRAATETLAPTDMVAVVAFDSESQVFVRLQRAANHMRISSDIARLQSGGGTNIFPGLKDAFELLQGITGFAKQVIVLSDGEAPTDGIAELVADMHAARITVSAVGLPGADRNMLQMIADGGDGRLYMVEDLGALPKVIIKELERPPAKVR